ncbi:MAG: archaeosortase A [Thermoplasmatota archaeon]
MDAFTPFLIGALCVAAVCAHYLRREPLELVAVYVWSLAALAAALALGPSIGDPRAGTLMDAALIVGLVMLGARSLARERRESHLCAILGWQAFGLYWTMEVPNYVSLHPDDPVNVILYAPALALFSVFSIHEWRLYKSEGDRRALRFIAGMTFVGAGTYFLFARVPLFSSGLIWATAAQTSWLYNLLGASTEVGHPITDAVTGEISVPVINSGISIILACTGIEAIVIFLGAFLCVEPREDPWRGYRRLSPRIRRYMGMSMGQRRLRALLYTIPPIWVLNLVRNISIIWLVDSGTTSFDVAHGYLGKLFSFVVLLALAMIVFDLVPEIYDDLLDLYRLGRKSRAEAGNVEGAAMAGREAPAAAENGPGAGERSGGPAGADGTGEEE